VVVNEIIRVEGIAKRFGEVRALEDVSFSILEEEVLALVGDNGAGKSTLIKILSGVLPQTSGTVYVRGDPVDLGTYNDAEALGIQTVYQDLAIAPNRTVAQNIFLGDELLQNNALGRVLKFTDDERMEAESRELLGRLDLDLDPRGLAKNLSGGEQQSVAIARALQSDPEIIILDEPTSALSIDATQRILDLVERLNEQGVTIVLISHNMEVVFELADRVAVLASGSLMGVEGLADVTEDELVSMMMGRTKETV
jgi:ABC-type sugar transport system ATPase subunit